MKVFISWSKDKSKEFAIETKKLLENLSPDIETFVSDLDIRGGEDVQRVIIEQIRNCDKLILCFTKENKRAPWLLFEAGYARGLNKTVIPILFEADTHWHSWIDNPMNIAREISLLKDDFMSDFCQSFNITACKFDKVIFDKYIESINLIKDRYKLVDKQCEDLVCSLINNETFIAKSPYFRNNKAYFLAGFESHDLYKIITESFMYTGKYLWIYGRKNMKLFDGTYNKFFDYLKEKANNNFEGMDGIDFKCLFLDPESNSVHKAHKHQKIFISELNSTILRAKNVIGDNIQLQNCFRMYDNKREEIIIRIDNSIIYAVPHFDVNGYPQILTNTGFEVFSTTSEKGKNCIKIFKKIWMSAKKFNTNT